MSTIKDDGVKEACPVGRDASVWVNMIRVRQPCNGPWLPVHNVSCFCPMHAGTNSSQHIIKIIWFGKSMRGGIQ